MGCKLVLEDGMVFVGEGFGVSKTKIAEVIYHTGMVSYDEILTNPIYSSKFVCMSYPLIGNYGIAMEDYEAKDVKIGGLIVREYNDAPSNFRSTMTLNEAMEENDVCGISGIDTRKLVRHLRDNGSLMGILCDESITDEECLAMISEYKIENETEKVSTKKPWSSKTTNPTNNVVIIDLGVKRELAYQLNEYGCNVVVLPYNSTISTVNKYNPSGLIISDGPSDPNKETCVLELLESVNGKYPLLGLGMGADVIAIFNGGNVTKTKTNYYGCNYPVRNLNNKVSIVNLNHSYTINDIKLEVTHKAVIDDTTLGFRGNNVLGYKFLNEDVLKEFIEMMGGRNNAKKNRY